MNEPTYSETIRENMERNRSGLGSDSHPFGKDWETGWLLVNRKHFMDSEGFAAGTRIRVREYDRDPDYVEIQLPNGTILTESPNLISTYQPVSDQDQREEFNEPEPDPVPAIDCAHNYPPCSKCIREYNAQRDRDPAESWNGFGTRESLANHPCGMDKRNPEPCSDCGAIPENHPNAGTIPEGWKNGNMIAAGMIRSGSSLKCCGNRIRIPDDPGIPVVCEGCWSIFERSKPAGFPEPIRPIIPEGFETNPEDWERGSERVSESQREGIGTYSIPAGPGFESNGTGGMEPGTVFAHAIICNCHSCLGIDSEPEPDSQRERNERNAIRERENRERAETEWKRERETNGRDSG